ncbi:hypothetical protein EMGBS15_00840 [Filimonas sp.]|nr:hypothetical protein EMGBS15_00840 [Filimonas sp.]
MKKKVLFAALLMAAQSMTLLAQQRGGGSEYDPMAKPNIVKINLTSLVYKNFHYNTNASWAKRFLLPAVFVSCLKVL